MERDDDSGEAVKGRKRVDVLGVGAVCSDNVAKVLEGRLGEDSGVFEVLVTVLAGLVSSSHT